MLKNLKHAAWRLRKTAQEKRADIALDRRIASSLLLDIDYQLAAAGLKNPSYFTRFANNTQSRQFRDVIALAASHQRLRFDDLAFLFRLQVVEGSPSRAQEAILDEADGSILLRLASLLVNRAEDTLDLVDADAIFSYLKQNDIWGAQPSEAKLFALEAHTEACDVSVKQLEKALHDLLPPSDKGQAEFLRANQLLTPYAADTPLPKEVARDWSQTVSRLFTEEGLQRVSIPEGTTKEEILEALTTDTSGGPAQRGRSSEDVLVSVIMPTYQPDGTIFTAIRTVLSQTYGSLELVIIDDGSGPEYEPLFEEILALDPRIRVVAAEENAGAYAARNLGVKHSRGGYVTVQDDDDWAHAQKLEQLVTYLEEHPEVLAAAGSHVRFSKDGKFIRIGNRPQFSVPCYAAIMFRRNAFDEVGLWQEVRKAGDSEMLERVQAAQGANIPVVSVAPTSLTRVGAGRLTSGELNRGYIAPARRWYVSAYRRHGEATLGDPVRAAEVPEGVPAASVNPPGKKYEVDQVMAADYTHDCAATKRALQRASQVLKEGQTVALMQLESPLHIAASKGLPQVFDFLLANPSVSMLSYREHVTCEVLEVHGSGCVEYGDNLSSKVSAAYSRLVVGGEGLIEGKLPRPNLPRCIRNLERLAGPKPVVEAGDEETLMHLEALGYGSLIGTEGQR